MASPSTSDTDSGSDYANIPVSHEFRAHLRVAKAEDGLSYEEYLRQHVPGTAED